MSRELISLTTFPVTLEVLNLSLLFSLLSSTAGQHNLLFGAKIRSDTCSRTLIISLPGDERVSKTVAWGKL